jgi:hypothetical protein
MLTSGVLMLIELDAVPSGKQLKVKHIFAVILNG